MPKRKCKLTENELAIHNKAVKLRKMTDAQLVSAFENAGGRNNGVMTLINGLEASKCKGIGGGTIYKIKEFAKELNLI